MNRAAALLLPLLWLGAAALLPARAQAQDDAVRDGARPTRSIPLARGDFPVYDLPPEGAAAGQPARAVLVFASGDGGWTYWEDRACRRLARNGCYVLGIDTALYSALAATANRPVTQAGLAADFEQISEAAPRPLLADDAPVLWGGVGGGAAQAVAAAALTPPPPRLAGLLVANLRSRGRYGIGWTDRFGLPIRGGATFALADLAPSLGTLRVAQLQGTGSAAWLDHASPAWLAAVPGPHREFDFPVEWRHVGRATKTCLDTLDTALDWLLAPPAP